MGTTCCASNTFLIWSVSEREQNKDQRSAELLISRDELSQLPGTLPLILFITHKHTLPDTSVHIHGAGHDGCSLIPLLPTVTACAAKRRILLITFLQPFSSWPAQLWFWLAKTHCLLPASVNTTKLNEFISVLFVFACTGTWKTDFYLGPYCHF